MLWFWGTASLDFRAGWAAGGIQSAHPSGNDSWGCRVAPDGTFWMFGDKPESFGVDSHGQLTGAKKPNNNLINKEGYFPFPSVFDGLGNLYARGFEGRVRKYAASNFSDQGAVGFPEMGSLGESLAVDPSTNDVFLRIGPRIVGVHYSEPLVPGGLFEPITGLQGAGGFAFDGTGQALYVAEGTRISIFHKEPPSPPVSVGGLEVSKVGNEQVFLTGAEIANGAPASFHFEYGTDTSYGMSTADIAVPMSFFPVKFGAFTPGLQPGTIYHVRVVVTNSAGNTYGPDGTFKTYPFPPVVAPTPVPTPWPVSRPSPSACRTAGRTSSPAPPTPAAMTSSPTWLRARDPSRASRSPRTGCSTRPIPVRSPAPGTRPTKAPTPTSPPAPPAAGRPSTRACPRT